MVTDHDMYCESYRTQHYEEVPLGNAAKTVWHCQKVKTADTEYDAQPHNRSDFFAKKKAENRYNYNIQRRDESRFTGCGENAAKLLKQTGDKQSYAAANAAKQGFFVFFFLFRRKQRTFALIHNQHNRNKHDGCTHQTNPLEGDRTDMLHAAYLGYERCPPEHSC